MLARDADDFAVAERALQATTEGIRTLASSPFTCRSVIRRPTLRHRALECTSGRGHAAPVFHLPCATMFGQVRRRPDRTAELCHQPGCTVAESLRLDVERASRRAGVACARRWRRGATQKGAASARASAPEVVSAGSVCCCTGSPTDASRAHADRSCPSPPFPARPTSKGRRHRFRMRCARRSGRG